MRPSGQTFWLLGGRPGWRTAKLDGTSVSNQDGIRLAANSAGPLSFASSDGSLGGLVLPQGLAFDSQNTLYLLSPDGSWIKKFDPDRQGFVILAEVGGQGSDPRRFLQPTNLVITNDRMHVCDSGNRRVQVLDIFSLALTAILQVPEWQPVDIAAYNGFVYVLDSENARVYVWPPYCQQLRVFLERSDRKKQWSRVVIDQAGKLYLLSTNNPAKPLLEPADPGEQPFADAGDVRDRFVPPPLRLDSQGRFCLPVSLSRACGRTIPVPPPALETQLQLCPPFDRAAKRCSNPTPPEASRSASSLNALYVTDRELRIVRVFVDGGRKLRHQWGPFDATGAPVPAGPNAWDPVDVAANAGVACILDGNNQVVYRHLAGRERLSLLISSSSATNWWRIAVDEGGLIYLYTPGQAQVQVYTCRGDALPDQPYRLVAALFATPQSVLRPTTGLIFNRSGTPTGPVDPSTDATGPFYLTAGEWTSKPLDSLKYRCQWHRLVLSIANLPPGSKIEAFTYNSDDASDVSGVPDEKWQSGGKVVAPVVPPNCGESPTTEFDFLVQSGPGQFLSVRLRLGGDGYSTPAVQSMSVYYPRNSYLSYLPAVYSADDESRRFLEKFLSIFQTEWDAIDAVATKSEQYFDPDAVPAGPFLDFLAKQWLALPMEATWTEKQKRQLLSAAPKIYPLRGQVAGLRDYVAVYLANIANLDTQTVEQTSFPAILEGYRERQFLFLSQEHAAALGAGAPLWSPSILRRLQLGVYSQVGEVQLVSTGDPEHDVFQQYAHRFRIFIPACWVRTQEDERMVRRAIESEKPAHTSYDLELVEPHFRLGEQSSVGLDTIIGDLPVMTVACASGDNAPSSLPKCGRLGYDAVLGSRTRRPAPAAGIMMDNGLVLG